MKTIICKRCHQERPKGTSRPSKIWGGRVCHQCAIDSEKIVSGIALAAVREPQYPMGVQLIPSKSPGFFGRLFRRKA